MNKITRKLCSRSGASMILALVFLLFALFVGGTVLASAAANGYRAAHLSDQQEYLNHRSAALLVAEELKNGLTLTITETITDTPVESGGTTSTRKVIIKAPNEYVMTPLQRIMVEAAVAQFIKTEELALHQVLLEDFYYDDKGSKTPFGTDTAWWSSQWWLLESSDISTIGTLTLTLTGAGSDVVLPVTIECLGGNDDRYDILITLGDSGGMTVSLDGYTGSSRPVTTKDESTGVVTTTKQSAISWDAPVIEKGTAPAEEEDAE